MRLSLSVFRSACRMSEPPRKKKKTILDFFRKGNSKSDQKIKDTTAMNHDSSSNSNNASLKDSDGTVSHSINTNIKKNISSECEADEALSQTLQMDEYNSEMSEDTMSGPSNNSQFDMEKDIPSRKPSQRGSDCIWRGTPMKVLNKSPDCLERMPPLHHTDIHTVLFNYENYSYDPEKVPSSSPVSYKDKWDNDHVRMPCSHLNEYPVKGKDGKQTVRRRWDMIREVLQGPIPGPFELEEAILTYNSRYAERWNFHVMHQFFCDELANAERNEFFNKILKDMVKLALQLPLLCTQPIPLLKKGKTHSVTFTQQQIASLLANAFFCTFPRRNAKQKNSEYSNYSSINFNSLFDGHPSKIKLEKLKCIVNYFKRVTTKLPTGNVTFTRQCVEKNKLPNWTSSNTALRGLHVSAEGTIEDDGIGFLQVDFANKYLGGGVLGQGCVQEEIRFLICPEMFISRLITECLDENECLIMKGCERFSDYDGYAQTFRWKGNFEDKSPRDSWGRLCTDVVAIDALIIHTYGKQFRKDLLMRELNKAYCGFLSPNRKSSQRHLQAVCTGNWGCGAFGGDKRLKGLIQLMAAAEAQRDTCYFTFDDKALRDDLYNIHQYLTTTNPLEIGTIMTLISRYEKEILGKCYRKPKLNLYEYITRVFDGTLENTDTEPESPQPDFSQSSQEAMLRTYSDQSHKEGTKQENCNMERQNSEDYKANTP